MQLAALVECGRFLFAKTSKLTGYPMSGPLTLTNLGTIPLLLVLIPIRRQDYLEYINLSVLHPDPDCYQLRLLRALLKVTFQSQLGSRELLSEQRRFFYVERYSM